MPRLILLFSLYCAVLSFDVSAIAQDDVTTAPAVAETEATTETSTITGGQIDLPPQLLRAYEAADVTTDQLEMLYQLDSQIMQSPVMREAARMTEWADQRRGILSDEQLRIVRRELRRALGVTKASIPSENTTATVDLAISTTASQ